MKATAKRILATLLAALMIFGVFAVGASAIDEEEPEVEVAAIAEEPETETLAGPYADLTGAQQLDLLAILLDLTNYANVDKEKVYNAAWIIVALELSRGNQGAATLKDGKTVVAYDAAKADALGNLALAGVNLSTGDSLEAIILAFLADREAAIVAAYKAGTLRRDGPGGLFSQYLTDFITAMQPVVVEFVRPEVVDAAKNYAKWVKMFWEIQLSKLGKGLKNWALKLLDIVRTRVWNKIKDYIASADWPALKSRIGALAKAFDDGANALKLIWDWIVYFLFFGWLS
ncbi:MAG: hypothetical protein FWF60_05590 [Oscillospiraceae bacterium]|nr:hypothetical protein [Oscillospiraceae bacterium]